ncbi:MAG: acyl transferase [Chitinophagaceae bacterium]|nr:acyl transferase [Chitinophagaceae bacterium]
MQNQWNHKVFNVQKEGFEALALGIFLFQYKNNLVYKAYVDALLPDITAIDSINKIPFLPVRFFKSLKVATTDFEPQTIFESSGTSGSVNSRHFVKDLLLYEESFMKGFELFYGSIKDYCIVGLLPSYLERGNSSLVYMVNKLIERSEHPQSGFYLDEFEKLASLIIDLEKKQQKTLLIGVTFALLDFAEQFPMSLQYTTILETGGMKGRRKEMIREELHGTLESAFKVPSIHSEYGMTELLSQAYSKGDGIFNTPPWMKILVRDEEDPLLVKKTGSGIINIIDLANIYSCSFIATDDAGKIYDDNSFEVLGRVDGSDLRGCSLMTV